MECICDTPLALGMSSIPDRSAWKSERLAAGVINDMSLTPAVDRCPVPKETISAIVAEKSAYRHRETQPLDPRGVPGKFYASCGWC